MPLIKPNPDMKAHLQVRIAALAGLHRDISTLGEAADLAALMSIGNRINDQLRELGPKVLSEHEVLGLREQVRAISEDCRRLLDS